MKLSIITINYNNKAGLEKTIASVMQQTWRDFEWILIDGGSTDGSKEVIEELAKDPASNISYWCSEPDKGIYNAMNKGIAKANGEYLQFLNSGDNLHCESSLEDVFKKNIQGYIIYGNCHFIDGEKQYDSKYPNTLKLSYILESNIAHPATFIRRECFNNFKYPENYKISSDWVGWATFYLKGYTFAYTNVIVSDFYLDGISSKNEALGKKEVELATKQIMPPGVLDLFNDYKLYKKVYYGYDYYLKKTLSIAGKGKLKRRLLHLVLIILDRI